MDTESKAIIKHVFDLKRPGFWDKSLITLICGYFLGTIPFILDVSVYNSKLFNQNLIMVGVILIALITISIFIRILIRPRSGSQIAFEQLHLVLPPRVRFLRTERVPFSELKSVIVRGKGRRRQMLLDTQKKLYAYYMQDFVALKDPICFVETLVPFINACPNGENQWESIQRRISIFKQAKRRKGIAVWILCAILLAVYFAEMHFGVHQNKFTLIDLGANVPLLVREGEWFRLFGSNFLHINFIHLMFNVAALGIVGLILEQLMGVERFLLVYLISALGGAIASMLTAHTIFSVGASTAIYGLIGSLAVFNVKFRNQLPAGYRIPAKNWFLFIGLSFILPVVIPQIDIAAHIGGFVTGASVTYLLYRGWKKFDVMIKPGRLVFVAALMAAVLFLCACLIGFSYISGGNDRDITRLAQAYVESKKVKPKILNSMAWRLVTNDHLSDEKLQLALQLVRKALMLDANNHQCLDTLATIYYRLGMLDRAIRTEREAMSLHEGAFYASQLAYFLSSNELSERPILIGNITASDIQFSMEWVRNGKRRHFIIKVKVKKDFSEGLISYLKVLHKGREVGVIRFALHESYNNVYQYSSREQTDLKKLQYKAKLQALLIDNSGIYIKPNQKTWSYWPIDRRVPRMYKN